jgi:beta-lactamase superfamily II metal-dependent hydrolase
MFYRLRTLVTACAVFVASCLAWADEVEFHFIYVGQGDSTLIKTPNGKNVLVDCGSTKEGDAEDVRDYLLEQIGDEGVIDVLVVTHPDQDHYNFLPTVLEGIVVHRVLYVGRLNEHREADFDHWLSSHPNRERLTADDFDPPATPSDRFDGGNVTFHILSADIDRQPSRKNSRSIVLRVSFGDLDVMLTGDGTFATENTILGRYVPEFLDMEVLKIGHHGSSATSTSPSWLKAVRPETAVVSAAFNSQFQHPRRKVIDAVAHFTLETESHPFRWGDKVGGQMRLRNVSDFQEAIYSTATNANVVLTSDGVSYTVTHRDGQDTFPTSRPDAPRPDFERRLATRAAAPAGRLPLEDRVVNVEPRVIDKRIEAFPFNAGENVELITRDGLSVVGTLKESTKTGWVHLLDPKDNRRMFVRESEVVVVKDTQVNAAEPKPQ